MPVHYPFPKMVLFDWDNTLMDTTPVLYKAFCIMREHYDLPDMTVEEYREQTGLSLRETFPDIFGDKWEEAKQVYLGAYQKYHLDFLTAFPDAWELVSYVREKVGKVGVVSNKTAAILQKEVAHLGWDGVFDAVVGAGDAAKDKPAADPVFKALEGTEITHDGKKLSAPVWFVGDGDADIVCARNSGCLPVRFAAENKDGADVLTVKSCTELLSVLYSYE